jgi:hypothetical protein
LAIIQDYQEDMAFSENGDMLMWYKGLGEISIVNVRSWDEVRIIENVSGNFDLKKQRKLC